MPPVQRMLSFSGVSYLPCRCIYTCIRSQNSPLYKYLFLLHILLQFFLYFEYAVLDLAFWASERTKTKAVIELLKYVYILESVQKHLPFCPEFESSLILHRYNEKERKSRCFAQRVPLSHLQFTDSNVINATAAQLCSMLLPLQITNE